MWFVSRVAALVSTGMGKRLVANSDTAAEKIIDMAMKGSGVRDTGAFFTV